MRKEVIASQHLHAIDKSPERLDLMVTPANQIPWIAKSISTEQTTTKQTHPNPETSR